MAYRECCRQYYRAQMQGNGMPVYSPLMGHGIFANLFRTVMPFIKNTVAPRLIKGAAGIATDVLSGQSFGSSAKKRGSNILQQTLTDVLGRKEKPVPVLRRTTRKRRPKRRAGRVKRAKDAF